ncbi:hypothetical protein B0H10DRAFT_2190859 [Mycena sp. CBHHK59/15]|nr:hypothetical protein B0H10DRAFT_2190859 [Mycena sp. CBHHK59/15]
MMVAESFKKSTATTGSGYVSSPLIVGAMADVVWTLGPLLVGGSIALVLSGIVTVQCIIFFKLYPNELRIKNAMDFRFPPFRFIVTSLFNYFISFFGDRARIDHIPWSIALSVVVTAIQTLIFHWFFAHKIYNSSRKNWWITAPIVILAFLRLFAASVSTTEMIRLHRYSAFTEKYPGWVFTTGLSLSAVVDILITGWLCYFLQRMRRRTASTSIDHVVNTLTLYTLENGLLTCLTTTASLICWLTMPTNLVFMGLHFVIGKLYANSLLISLNTRKGLCEMRWDKTTWDTTVPALSAVDFTSLSYPYGGTSSLTTTPSAAYCPQFKLRSTNSQAFPLPSTLEVTIERTVERSSNDLSEIIQQEEYGRRFHHPRPRSPHRAVEPWRSLP